MRRFARFWVLLVLLLPIIVKAELPTSTSVAAIVAPPTRVPDPAAPLVLPYPVANGRRWTAARSRLPAGFIENLGQVDEQVKFYVRAARQTLWITQSGLVFDLARTTVSDPPGEEGRARPPTKTHERVVFAQEYLGRNVDVTITPEQPLPGVHNFLLGADPSKWRIGLRAYADVVYHDVWDRIDLRVSHRDRAVEQEFVVKPGGDPSRIRVAYRGTDGLRIAEDGSLAVRTAFGEVRESPPTIYQEIDGRRVTVSGRFKLLGANSYAFEVDAYERRYALIIDPTLAYATYLGGGADEDPLGQNIAVDGAGNVYVAGATTSSNFPATVAGSVYSGGTGLLNGGPGGDVFVAKLNPTGSALVYAIYLGGSGDEAASGVAVDSAGSVYLSGSTTSTDFPITPGAFQTTRRTSVSQGFVVKLNSTGNGLVYSTYLGGSLGEQGGGIAVDSTGHAYVTGITGSSDFPTLNSLQPLRGIGDVFITKLTPDGSGLVYSTLLGGATLPPSPPPPPGAGATQWGKAIAVDATDQAYVAGYTTATDFPRANADQSTLSGGLEAFVTKLKADGTLAYSTYLGGSGDEQGLGIAVDAIGNAYVTGTTASADFPTTAGAYQTAPKPGSTSNAFVTKLSPAGAKVYSTYLGGSAGAGGYGVAVDGLGIAYVTGFNASSNFPILDAFQPVQGSGFLGFVTALTPSGSKLVYSSFLGGAGRGIAVDASGQAYVAGMTNLGTNIPTNLLSYGGGQDAFVVKVNAPSADVSVTKFGNPSPVLSLGSLTYTITVRNAGPSTAVNIALTDTVPASTTFQSLSPSAGCTTPPVGGSGVVICSIGDLAPGESKELDLVVQVTAASGSVTNIAAVSTATSDPAPGNNSATVVTPVSSAGSISGTVCAGAAPPCIAAVNPAIAGALINVSNTSTGFTLASVVTDGSGFFQIAGLVPGNYRVSARAPGFATRWFNGQLSFGAANTVTVTDGAITQNINFGLPGSSGGIGGKVTLADGVTPVANASISIRILSSDFVVGVTTDASGNYNTGRILGAGNYLVRASAAGLPPIYFDGARSAATARAVAVVANSDTPNINFRLSQAAGGISGRVTSATTGAPLAAINVSVFDGATGGLVLIFTTDATGHYDTALSLAPGQYKVTAAVAGSETIAYNNRFSVATGDPVTVTAGNTTPGIDIALPALGAITGRVTQAVGGAAIAGAIVDVWDYFSNTFLASATTAADGSYTINGLNPLQAYRVRGRATNFGMVFHSGKSSAETADVVTVPAGGLLTIDFALALAGGIIGKVVDAGTLVGITTVSIDLVDGASTNLAINNFLNFAVTTNASGNFNTGRILAPGTYKLRARKFNSGYIQSFYPTGLDLSTAQTVTVVAGQDTTLPASPAFAMTMGGTITGTIRDRVSGQPISNASVAAQRVASSNFFADNLVTTNASGVFTITGLHPGEYLIMAVERAHILGYYSGIANSPATDFGTGLPIQITGANTVSGVDVSLQPGGGEVRGRVTRSDNGQPARPGTDVNIRGPWPRTNAVWNFNGGASGTPPFTLNTDGQGGYSFSGLAPGKYVIEANRFQIANGTAIGFYPFGSVSRNSALPVTVTDGGVSTADFQVFGFSGGATPRAIRGILRDPSNNPIRDAFVQVYEPNANGFIRTGTVFDDGSFVMDGLPPGRYLLSANTETTFVTTFFPAELTLNTATVLDLTSGDVNGINLVLSNTAGTITGTVTRSDTGQPVLGASISVRTFVDAALPGAASRVDGTYQARGLTPGAYKVRVSAPGFVTKYFVVGVPGGARTLEDGSFVTVTASANTPNINVVLDPTGGALTGTVKDQSTLQPVVATVVAIDDAAGSRVQVVSTDVNGSWITEGLGPGSYKVTARDAQASRHATHWYSAKPHQLVADPVTVAAVGTTGGIDMLVPQVQGSISGSVHLSNGTTPLPSAVVEILDAATGGLVRRAITGSDGRYSVPGLAPGNGLYFARARALGFADHFYPSLAPTRADATALTVTSGGDTGNVNFNLTRSSDINGTITYSGSQSGALRVRLYSDAVLTKQVYETVIASPSLGAGQSYSFALAAPDTRGLLPGTYYLKAFVDGNGNAFQDPTDAFGQFGAPDAILVVENADVAGKSFSLATPPATTNTPPTADAQTVIFVQGSSNNSIVLTGADAQTATVNLTYSVVSNPLHGALAAGANPQQRFYTPELGFTGTDTFTFTVTDRGDPDNCGAPSPTCSPALTSAPATVTIQVNPTAGTTSMALSKPAIPGPSAGFAIGSIEIKENATGVLQAGSAINLGLPIGTTFRGTPVVSLNTSNGASVNAAILESASVLSFTLATPSTTGPATILISRIFVDVGAEFLSDGVTSAALLTTISGPNPGLTAATVQNGKIVAAEAGPVITSAAPSTAAQGASGWIVTITGANFATNATVSFGSGVTVVSATIDNPNQIRATLNIDAGAQQGKRNLVVTNPSTDQSVTKTDALEITTPPTVSAVTGPLVHCENQLVAIQGTGFQSPTTTPPDLFVAFAPAGIVVTNVGFSTPTTITAIVDVAAAAADTTYSVTVTNPDGGVATLGQAVSVVSNSCEAAPPPKGQPTPPPPPPAISSLSSASGPIGSALTINGSGFSGTPSVTLAGAGGARVTATVTQATLAAVGVIVPSGATSGNVTVAVNGVVSNAVAFTVTTPTLAGVNPSTVTTGVAGMQASLVLSGSRFTQGATMSFGGPAGDVTLVGTPIVAVDGTSISLTVSVPPTPQQTGPRDVTVTNPGACVPPAAANCLSSTLTGGLVIQVPPAASLTINLVEFQSNPAAYLPTVAQVSMTRLASGACNPATKLVTPGSVTLEATFASTTGLPAPQSVTFSIASSALPGTASNEDCEVDPSNPTKDFSIGLANPSSQQIVVNNDGGVTYRTTLFSYDWGGKVTITVTGTTGGSTVTGTLGLPVDADGDDLPDAYEQNLALNRDVVTGLNVLDFQNPDKNGSGVKDRDDRFVKDGLSNFEKYRGYYMVGPAPGATGAFGAFERLGAGVRHFFVRGRGFRDDPAVPAGSCGINPSTGAPEPDATLSASNPCPAFQIGDAFKNIGVAIHYVSGSFTATTELPRASLVNPTVKTLDMATVVYDGVGCKGTEACDTTSKLGVRNWVFNTLGYTTPIGTATTYGSLSVFKRAVESYFNNRPYQHRTTDPARVLAAPDGTPMLAPVNIVGDSAVPGADNGRMDTGDILLNGQLVGDTYIPGSFAQQLSSFDANNDGCVEAPTVADPTSIQRCSPAADTGPAPSATKQQVVRSVVTHELGHAVGLSHTTDVTDIMYQATINFTRDGHFSDAAAGLVQIHNKGQQ